MGTRCHHLALYVVYENPMPMVADVPSAYEGQSGFDFIRQVPTIWDETRFIAGDPGQYVVVARRKDDTWYVGGITNWTPREIEIPLAFVGDAVTAELYVDGSMDESRPNAIVQNRVDVASPMRLKVSMAPGGGFVATIQSK